MEPNRKFRFSSQNGLFTWITREVQPDLSIANIVEHINGLGCPIQYLTVGREIAPNTGSIHFHAYIEFVVRPNFKNRELLLVHGYGVNV